ncbi:hypothetical protein [Schaalia turicensis]
MTTTPTPKPAPSSDEQNITPSAPAKETPVSASSTPLTHEFGRIDENGTVYVVDNGTERVIGGYPEGVPAEPFALYERRFADIEATVKLFEHRLATLAPKDIDLTLATITEALESPNALGNLAALRERVESVKVRAEERKEVAKIAGNTVVWRLFLPVRYLLQQHSPTS